MATAKPPTDAVVKRKILDVRMAVDEIAVRMKSGPDRPAGRPHGSKN